MAATLSVGAPAPSLSDLERAQLGSVRYRSDGSPSAHPWPPAAMWPVIRSHLVARSLRANPLLDAALTAYTPGETEQLLSAGPVRDWHRAAVATLPRTFSRVVFVPCAKTKPWTGPAAARSRLYSAYNSLRDEFTDTCFVTISEPLGVVPAQRWADFPQYDNPGLFTDDAQRSGMTTKQWQDVFGQIYGVPFDVEARRRCLRTLGRVVAEFVGNNAGRQFVSFVDSGTTTASTHQLMLDEAVRLTEVAVSRFPKRAAARSCPLGWMRSILAG